MIHKYSPVGNMLMRFIYTRHGQQIYNYHANSRECTSSQWIEALWKHLPNVHVDPCSLKVSTVSHPIGAGFRIHVEVSRHRSFQDSGYAFKCTVSLLLPLLTHGRLPW